MKKKNKKLLKKDHLLEDESVRLHKSKGNGILRRQIWVDGRGEVTRYSLTYINYHLYSGDNGRVLGYDNAHNYHHKHYMGTIEPVTFNNFLDIENRFQQEFEALHEKIKKKR
jgi:hypothetical protein